MKVLSSLFSGTIIFSRVAGTHSSLMSLKRAVVFIPIVSVIHALEAPIPDDEDVDDDGNESSLDDESYRDLVADVINDENK